MPGRSEKEVKDFIYGLKDDKLKNFVSSEKTIFKDDKLGFRLDHQGVSQAHAY